MSETNAYNPKNDIEIAINNVSVVFKDNKGNNVKALDNVDFDIHKGEFISLLGPSGCGKTTLLRTIADLLEPTSGNVSLTKKSVSVAEDVMFRAMTEVIRQLKLMMTENLFFMLKNALAVIFVR